MSYYFCYEIFCPICCKKCKTRAIFYFKSIWKRRKDTVNNSRLWKRWNHCYFQTVGLTTYLLSYKDVGEYVSDVVGPLGTPSQIKKYDGSVVIIGGGVGIAPIYPIVREFKKLGNKVITILGARSKNLLFWEGRFKNLADETLITTDDGSYSMKGFVTDALKILIDRGEKISQVTAIGPPIMMRNVCNLTKPYNIKTVVSLNSIMVDGTGMCGVCRVEVGNETKLTCQDGPEFDGHLVNLNILLKD